MKKSVYRVVFIIIASLLYADAFATDLMTAFRDAYQNDPEFRAARSTLLSEKTALPIARAGLLPSILGTGQSNRNRFDNGSISGGQRPGRSFSWSHRYGAQITQPIFNWQAWKQIGQATATVKAAFANFNNSEQDLMLRVSNAYFAILQAQDTLRFTTAEKLATERQLDQAQQRYKVGLDAITSVYEAQAEYDRVVSDEIAAKNDVANAFEDLRRLTGVRYKSIAGLKAPGVKLIPPSPNRVKSWLSVSTRQNYQVIAQHYTVIAAKKNISIQAAANLPTVNAVGSYTDLNDNAPGFVNTDLQVSTLSFQMNFPVYQGGLTIAQTKRAEADYETALAGFDNVYRTTQVRTRQIFNNVIAGISKIKADRQAVKSSESSLESSEAAFKVGTRTIVDVLDAQRDLFDAQRTLARDQYAYITDILSLKQIAGILSPRDLAEINTWLSHFSATSYTPKAHQNTKPAKIKLNGNGSNPLNPTTPTTNTNGKAKQPDAKTTNKQQPEKSNKTEVKVKPSAKKPLAKNKRHKRQRVTRKKATLKHRLARHSSGHTKVKKVSKHKAKKA